MKHLLGILGLVVIVWGATKEEAIAIELISPMEHSIHHEEMASVVVTIKSSGIEGIIISSESNQSSEILRQVGRNTYCKTISLIPGENTINVVGFGKNGSLEKLSTVIYHDIVSDKAYKYPPKNFSSNHFHLPENEKRCASCHKMEVNEVKGISFENPSDSNCFTCHKKLTTRGQGHAPAINWLCTQCHQTQKESELKMDSNSSRFTVSRQIGKICLTCHKKEKETWGAKRFHHMPVDADQCTRCHNPHSSQNHFYLKAKPWELCTSCHIEKINGSHFLNTFVNKKHPTRGKPDPSRPGKELECISCHNPHASDTRSLIEANSPAGICVKCHKK